MADAWVLLLSCRDAFIISKSGSCSWLTSSLPQPSSGPAERKGATTADKDISLTLEVTTGLVETADYTLRAKTIGCSSTENPEDYNSYLFRVTDPALQTTVDSMNGKNLKELVTATVLKAGEKKTINISVTTRSRTFLGAANPIWGKSAIFTFEILDKDSKVVAGVVKVNWTTAF